MIVGQNTALGGVGKRMLSCCICYIGPLGRVVQRAEKRERKGSCIELLWSKVKERETWNRLCKREDNHSMQKKRI